jgi:hypothetical protein
LLEKKKQNKHNRKDKKCETKPHYKHIDDAINDAYLLSDLRKPAQMITKTDEDGQTQKKSKCKKLSPILFVKIEHKTGKKNRKTKTKIVKKALVDTGASASIVIFVSAKGLPLNKKTETKKWSTAAGVLNTSAKTKRLQFSLPELQSARKIEKSFDVLDIELKNYDMIISRDL